MGRNTNETELAKQLEKLMKAVEDHLLEFPEHYGSPLHRAWLKLDNKRKA